MSTVIDDIEAAQVRKGLPSFAPGDRVRVHFLVIEGNRKRPQVFEGVVLKRQGSGARETFTVRKQSFGVGVERTFPLHSPKIEKLEVASRGRVRRAKLYYLRGRVGKAARVAERRWGIDEDMVGSSETGAVDAAGEGLEPIDESTETAESTEGTEESTEGTEESTEGTEDAAAAEDSDAGAEETSSGADAEPEAAEKSESADEAESADDNEQSEEPQAVEESEDAEPAEGDSADGDQSEKEKA